MTWYTTHVEAQPLGRDVQDVGRAMIPEGLEIQLEECSTRNQKRDKEQCMKYSKTAIHQTGNLR